NSPKGGFQGRPILAGEMFGQLQTKRLEARLDQPAAQILHRRGRKQTGRRGGIEPVTAIGGGEWGTGYEVVHPTNPAAIFTPARSASEGLTTMFPRLRFGLECGSPILTPTGWKRIRRSKH